LPLPLACGDGSPRITLRHAHAVELLHEGIALPLIQRQLGHAYLSTTGTYLEGISSEEIIGAIHGRKAPMMHASTARVVAASLLLREGSGRRPTTAPVSRRATTFAWLHPTGAAESVGTRACSPGAFRGNDCSGARGRVPPA
jgi:hypothetical protein